MQAERIEHRRPSQTGSEQVSVVVRLDVFEDGQHVGAVHPAVLAVLLLGELVKVVDLLLDGRCDGTDVVAALALRVSPAWRRDEEVERVGVGECAQRVEERSHVGLREGKRGVEAQRGEIDPLRPIRGARLLRSAIAAAPTSRRFGARGRRGSLLPSGQRTRGSRSWRTAG